MNRHEFLTNAGRNVEARVDVMASGWLLSGSGPGELMTWDGVRIRWRVVGERRWRKTVVVPDADQGQTIESLTADVDALVAAVVALYEASA